MRRGLSFLLAVLTGLTCFAAPAAALPRGTKVETYRANLDFPVDMAWVPGTHKIFFTEKNTGAIRVMRGRALVDRPCAVLPVANSGEQGALGLVLHPRFKRNHFLYVMYTNASPEVMRVTRFRVVDDRCTDAKRILGGIPAGSGYHNGGQLEFVGGKLFVSTGENHDPALAQSRSSLAGKILRLNPDGSVPDSNPFGNAVWSYGHRNPFGLARRPGTRALFETENGPQCDDELNRIRKATNYGWGDGYDCGTAGVGTAPHGPLRRWTPTIVPTDPWWYRGRLKALSGSLFMGDFSAGRLHRFVMNDRGTRVRADRIVYDADAGIVDVSKGPGGWLYFLTPGSIERVVAR